MTVNELVASALQSYAERGGSMMDVWDVERLVRDCGETPASAAALLALAVAQGFFEERHYAKTGIFELTPYLKNSRAPSEWEGERAYVVRRMEILDHGGR